MKLWRLRKNSDILKTKPWNAEIEQFPNLIYEPKGMIGPEERRCYYWLGKNWASGRGCIVDAGAFVGASTLCFAAGAAAGDHRDFNGQQLVHAYDYFKVVDKYVADAISRDFRPIGDGESYLDIFEHQTAAYKELIKTYPGDFLTHKWHGDAIELLFIDVAKTEDLNAHVIGEFFPSLIPDRSVVVHQDYYHCWHPYIHISMEFFNEEFELVDPYVPHQSRVWRLMKPLPEEKVARMCAYDLANAERLALLGRLIEKSSDPIRQMIKVIRIWQLCLDGDWDAASAGMNDLKRQYNLANRKALWATQALEVEERIKRATA
jgi:hypothetical protein